MGSIIGKQTVAEPPFQVLLHRTTTPIPAASLVYEIRSYGERFAAEVSYESDTDGSSAAQNSPFRSLARYIGVFGTAQNERSQSMAMTAPVGMRDDKRKVTNDMDSQEKNIKTKIMKFFLPAEYDDMSKIPKPIDPCVTIKELPPALGAVYRYNGRIDEENNRMMAKELATALMKDGVEGLTEEYVMDNFEYWGYNPPFTLPLFRRNEVWVELSKGQVDDLLKKFNSSTN